MPLKKEQPETERIRINRRNLGIFISIAWTTCLLFHFAVSWPDNVLYVQILHFLMQKTVNLNAVIPAELAGKRLDQALARMFTEHSRSRLQAWIKDGLVSVNNETVNQRKPVRGGEYIEIRASYETQEKWSAEDIPVDIIYEDKALMIINKPPGLVVHPGAGNRGQTLLNALLHHDPGLEIVPRAGIVQRLDKDTSGIMVVARTPECHNRLVADLQARTVKREYQAIVNGVMTAGGTIDKPIGRHPRKRTQMAVVEHGKPAITHYRVVEKFSHHTHIRIQLETGRTHQIRVHMASLKHPLVGDPVYAGRAKVPKQISDDLLARLQAFPRQALHACALSLTHPLSQETVTFEVPLPEDMQALLSALRANEA